MGASTGRPRQPMSTFPGTFPHGLPPIAVAMAGIDHAAIASLATAPGGGRVKAVIAWLAATGARGARIDATMPGIRPRELDRSGRRDLAALLRRSELAFAGVDVFVPPEHLIKPDTVDRAVSSILGAIDLAADLAALAAGSVVTRPPSGGTPANVSVSLHAKTPPDVVHALSDHAAGRSVRVADHARPPSDAAFVADESAAIGVGLDPASVLASGGDVVALAARLGRRTVSARLSDVPSSLGAVGGTGRVIPGTGRLDVGAYLVTLATVGYSGHAILDLSGLRQPAQAITSVRAIAVRGV